MSEAGRSRNDEDLILRLGEVQSAEKTSNQLTKLPDDFYERTSSHLRAILAELENCNPEQGRTPDEHYYRLSEKLKRAKEVLERIYATRERKIVLLALNQSRKGGPREDDRLKTSNMLSDEADLFYTLKVELETVRERLLKYDTNMKRQLTIRPESGIDTTTEDFIEEPPVDHEKKVRTMSKPGPGSASEDPSKGGPEVRPQTSARPTAQGTQKTEGQVRPQRCAEGSGGTVMVKALMDVGPFVLPDGRSINMRKNDIASLPEPVANVLIGSGLLAVLGEGS